MGNSNKADEDQAMQVYEELSIKNGPESWQIKDFLTQNQEKFDINNVSRIPQKEIKTNMMGQKETIEFDLMTLKDGTVVKGNVTTIKDPDDDDSNKSSFGVDMSKITDPEEAKEVLSKLLDITLQSHLRFHPAGTELRLYGQGMGKWAELAKEVEKEKCAEYAAAFQEKGIKLYMSDKLMVDDKPEPDGELENSSQEKRRGKAWDVPKGAPDARPKRE
jgi:hypothetical protein